jgi:hypothetical protein
MILIRGAWIKLEEFDIRNSISDDPHPRKVDVPDLVSNGIVLLTVNLKANLHLGTVEVKSIRPDRMLSPKFELFSSATQ